MSGNGLGTDRARTDCSPAVDNHAGVERVSSWIGSSLFPLPAHSPRTAGRRPSLVAPTGRRSAGQLDRHILDPLVYPPQRVALWIAYPCHPLPRAKPVGCVTGRPARRPHRPSVSAARKPTALRRLLCERRCTRGPSGRPHGMACRGRGGVQPLFPACRPGPGRRHSRASVTFARPVRAGVGVLSAGDAVGYAPLTGPRTGEASSASSREHTPMADKSLNRDASKLDPTIWDHGWAIGTPEARRPAR